MIGASVFEITFRIVHIMFAVAWAGSAFLFAVFIEPSAAKLGPAAGPMMQELVDRRKVGEIVTGIAGVAVIGGWILWWHDWHLYGSLGDWIGSAFGTWLTIGGVAATIAFFAGMIGIPPNIKRLSKLGTEIRASGSQPTPEQAAQMHAIQERLSLISRVDLGLLVVAVFCMATARYW
jgi:uncharacterized membrane protein